MPNPLIQEYRMLSPGPPPLYYEDTIVFQRKKRYCIRQVKMIKTKAEKVQRKVNIQLASGDNTVITVDNVEKKKICEHVDHVTARIQKLHKSGMWSIRLGCSLVGKNATVMKTEKEVEISNVRAWVRSGMDDIEEVLNDGDEKYDGIVCMFSLTEEANTESEEVMLTMLRIMRNHGLRKYKQRMMNQADIRILEERRKRCRKENGYLVYLAYQLVESITFNQVMVETLLYGVDIEKKKKEILADLSDDKISVAVSDKIRKVTKEVRYYMRVEQVEILHQVMREVGRDKNRTKQVFKTLQVLGGNINNIEKIEESVARRECRCEKKRIISTL